MRCFWDPIRAYGLFDLLYTAYQNVSYGMLTALCERWNTWTSSFHLPMGEMTVTLDDAACLLHIPIEGKMLCHDKKVS